MGRSALAARGAQVRSLAEHHAIMAEAARVGPMRSSHDIFRLMTLPSIAADRAKQENVWTVNLSIHAYLISPPPLIARGPNDHVDVDLPDIYRAPIEDGARYFVLVHNHPSGYATPSDADGRLTYDAGRGALEVDLVMLDHVVIGAGQYYSFRDRQLWRLVDQRGARTRWAA